jgi:hypothetical protein
VQINKDVRRERIDHKTEEMIRIWEARAKKDPAVKFPHNINRENNNCKDTSQRERVNNRHSKMFKNNHKEMIIKRNDELIR